MKMILSRPADDLAWQRRYVRVWLVLALFGVAAFLLGDKGVVPIAAQSLFFVAYFAIVLWPISRMGRRA